MSWAHRLFQRHSDILGQHSLGFGPASCGLIESKVSRVRASLYYSCKLKVGWKSFIEVLRSESAKNELDVDTDDNPGYTSVDVEVAMILDACTSRTALLSHGG